jgi:hypothetical protein
MKTMNFCGQVTQVISNVEFIVSTLAGQGEKLFQGWDVNVIRKGLGNGYAPQGDKEYCSDYVSASGKFTIRASFDTSPISVGDLVYLIHPFLTNNTNIVDLPSDNIKDSDIAEYQTAALALTLLNTRVFTGKLGSARINFDLKVIGAGTASAVIYKNGVPVVTNTASIPDYTVHSDATGTYQTFTQDISGLSVGDLIQVWGMVSAAPCIASICNMTVGYDIIGLSAVQSISDMIYYDSIYGVTGTDWPRGSKSKPTNNITDLKAMCLERGVKNVHVSGAITLNQDFMGYNFWGESDFVNSWVTMGANNFNGSTFHGLWLRGGTNTGRLYAFNCKLDCSMHGYGTECLIGTVSIMPAIGGLTEVFYNCYADASETSTIIIFNSGALSAVGLTGVINVQMRGVLARAQIEGNTLAVTLVDLGGGIIDFYGFVIWTAPGAIVVNDYTILTSWAAAVMNVPAVDSVANVLMRDVIGNKADTASLVVNLTNSLMRYIKGLVNHANADLVLTETGGTLTADGTEQNVVIDNAPTAVFKPLHVKINFDNMIATDTVIIRQYERISAGGALDLCDEPQTYVGVDGGLAGGQKHITIDLDPNRYGFKVTLEQSAHVAYKDFVYEYFYEV